MKISLAIIFLEAALATKYLVQLKSPSTFEALLNTDDTVRAVHHIRPLIEKAFSFGGFEGFSGDFDSDIVGRLRKNPLVEEITSDIIVKTCNEYNNQENAPRHLARLSQREALEDDELEFMYPSEFQANGVNAYVIDTGIQCDDPEFEGRCRNGADFTGEGDGDLNGHGTHVSGIIGSKTYGVAKKINLISVKALDKTGSGSLSSIISGIEFAVNNKTQSNSKGVINLSIGALRSNVLNRAVEVAYDSGLVLIAAAGNSNMDAGVEPSDIKDRLKQAATAGAINKLSLLLRPITPNLLAYLPYEDIESAHYESFLANAHSMFPANRTAML